MNLLWLVLFGLSLPLPAGDGAPVELQARKPVARVELRADAPFIRSGRLEPLIEVVVGEPYSPSQVAESIRNLHASGVAGEIAAYVEERGDDLDVVFAIWADYRVTAAVLEGDLVFKRYRLDRQVEVKPGEPLVEDRLLRTVFRLQDYHYDRGYREAQVRLRVDVDDERKEAAVRFVIAAGKPTRVESIALDGELGELSESELLAELELTDGKRYRESLAREDSEQLRELLIRRGFNLAQVDRPVTDYDSEANQIRVTYPVELGPKLEVRFDVPDIKALKKRDLLPFLGLEGYDQNLVVQAVRAVRSFYQEKGYYQADVQWRESPPEDGRFVLDFSVELGPKFELSELRFEGNELLSDAELAARVTTTPKQFLNSESGVLVDLVLDQDLANLRSFYALNGYAEATVGPAQITATEARLSVSIPILEGTQRRIVGLAVDGVAEFEPDELLQALPVASGGPFHPLLAQEAEAAIRGRYEARGYAAVKVETVEDWSPDRQLVDLVFRVDEGPRWTVDRFILRGNRMTRPPVVHRFLGLESGDPISSQSLLESQRRLFALGIFSSVEVAVAPGTPYQSTRDVVVRLEEGERRRVSYGLGFDSEDGGRGIFRYTQGNLFGTASSFTLDLKASQREQQFRLLLRKPSIGRRLTPISASVFGIEESEESFDSVRRGTQVELNSYTERTRLRLLYSYEVVQLDFDRSDPLLNLLNFDRDLRDLQLSSLGAAIFVDLRDDPLDPTRGWSANLAVDYAFPLLSADAEFVRGFLQQTAHFPLGRLGVLAFSLRAGAIEPTGTRIEDPTIPSDFPSSRIPISERFFAGGRSSHRAYERDRLGLTGQSIIDGSEVGGNGLLLFNFDYRFPISGGVGGTVFFDSGNVWPDWREISFGDLKSGVGVGVRYLSPVGPLRFDVGWKLDRETGEDGYELFLSFGNAF